MISATLTMLGQMQFAETNSEEFDTINAVEVLHDILSLFYNQVVKAVPMVI